jgi:hypothetical protein
MNNKIVLSSFKGDLENPEAGKASDLYKTIQPMISSKDDSGMSSADKARTEALKEQVRKGLVGLEYATGMKKNTGETFYDKHPVQAVATDVLSKSPGLGLGAAALGLGVNYRRQKKNFDMTEPSTMSRAGNPGVDVTNADELLNPSKGRTMLSDMEGTFGSFEKDPETRLALLDQLAKNDPATGFKAEHAALKSKISNAEIAHNTNIKGILGQLQQNQHDPNVSKSLTAQANLAKSVHEEELAGLNKQLEDLFTRAKGSDAHRALGNYANFDYALSQAKNKGGFNKSIGEGSKGLLKHIAPGEGQSIIDLAEKGPHYNLHKGNPHYNEELVKKIVSKFYDGHPEEFKAFTRDSLPRLADEKLQASGLRKGLTHMKAPLAIGAGIGLGGTALYHLIKAIQNRTHSTDKMREWKKTLLKSRGDFEGADKIQ